MITRFGGSRKMDEQGRGKTTLERYAKSGEFRRLPDLVAGGGEDGRERESAPVPSFCSTKMDSQASNLGDGDPTLGDAARAWALQWSAGILPDAGRVRPGAAA
jgi:hypothetical protein